MINEIVPPWIFNAIWKGGKWTEENEKLAIALTDSLKEMAKFHCIPNQDKIFAVNKHDTFNVYSQHEKSKK